MKKKILSEINRKLKEIGKMKKRFNKEGFTEWNEECDLRCRDLKSLRKFIIKLK